MFACFFVIVAVCISASAVLVAAAADGRPGDGREVIVAERFSAENGGNSRIVTVDPVRGAVRVLTWGMRTFFTIFRLTAVRSYLSGVYRRSTVLIGKVNIWIMRSDGGHARPLTARDGAKCHRPFDTDLFPDGWSVELFRSSPTMA